jgi:hypothetical protein
MGWIGEGVVYREGSGYPWVQFVEEYYEGLGWVLSICYF